MKLNKKTAGAVIVAVLILLLFFSNTVYNYNTPKVTAVKPARGSLSKLEIVSGIALWAEKESVYAVCAGTAGRVFASEGDAVEKGQILFEMDFDLPSARRRLAETENNILKFEADIRNLQTRLNSVRTALEATSTDEDPQQEREYAGQAGLIIMEINKAKIQAQNARLSFEYGALSKNDLTNTENDLKAVLLKYENEIDELISTIAVKKIDLENMKLSREAAAQIIKDYRDNAVIRSPVSGIVHELSAEKGKFFQENAFLVSIGVGGEFNVECLISLDNNFVNPGDTCSLSNANHTLKGAVKRVRPAANGKNVLIAISSGNVNDGETFDITFEKISDSAFTLVPNASVNQDNDGYFIYQIKRRKGIMGEEYYVERVNIFIGDSDHRNTAVIRGITFFEPIVHVSDKLLSAGQTVSLKNPEDFFEN